MVEGGLGASFDGLPKKKFMSDGLQKKLTFEQIDEIFFSKVF